MRTFIALEIPGWYADDVAAFARQLAARVEGRFLPRDTYHVTLAFLGNTTETQVRTCMDILDDMARLSLEPALEPDRLGTFGRACDCTLWLGFGHNKYLEKLACELRDRLEWRGIDFDRKTFVPHLTLARHAALPAGPLPTAGFPGRCRTNTVTLFKSTLQREGATYQPLYTVEIPNLTR